MRQRTVLVVGGYGAVGTEVCRLLASDARVRLVVGGRSGEKARALADALGGESLQLDARAPARALDGIDAVVNCFIDAGAPSTALPEAALERGLLYLDVAGVPVEHCHAVLALDGRAASAGATLVTALGCNPGIPALLGMSNKGAFERIDSVDFYFCLGSKLTGLSVLSLQGVGVLMKLPARVWEEGGWREAHEPSRKRAVGAPFSREVYFGPAFVTPDLLGVPAAIGASRLAFWSGIEKTLQGVAFLAGVRLGGTEKPERAARMLRWLKAVAGRDSHEEALLEMVVEGARDGRPATRHVTLSAPEAYLTAVAPAVVVQQWLDGELDGRHGAFVAPDVLPAASFLARLSRVETRMTDTWTPPGTA